MEEVITEFGDYSVFSNSCQDFARAVINKLAAGPQTSLKEANDMTDGTKARVGATTAMGSPAAASTASVSASGVASESASTSKDPRSKRKNQSDWQTYVNYC